MGTVLPRYGYGRNGRIIGDRTLGSTWWHGSTAVAIIGPFNASPTTRRIRSKRPISIPYLIVATTNNWSKYAEQALEHQTIPVTRLQFKDLANSPVD